MLRSLMTAVIWHAGVIEDTTDSTAVIMKAALYIKFGLLCAIIAGIWMLFLIPVVFYHLQPKVSEKGKESCY